MDNVQGLKLFEARLIKEGILKSFLCALSVGSGAALVTSVALMFSPLRMFWLAIVIGVGVMAAAMPVFYFRLFKPTNNTVASRVDRVGLAERLITMNELKDDDSYIAVRQREDARAALDVAVNGSEAARAALGIVGAAGVKCLAFSIPASLTGVVSALTALAFPIVVYNGFADYGYAPKASTVIEDATGPEVVYFEVKFLAEPNGYLEGDEEQLVESGNACEPVLAVAEDEFVFYGWTDDIKTVELFRNPFALMFAGEGALKIVSKQAEFVVSQVLEKTTYYALFAPMSEGDGEGDGEGEGDGAPDARPGAPQAPGNGNGNGQGGNQGGSGQSSQNDTIIDGETDFSDYYGEYSSEASETLAGDKDMPSDLREIIENYFGTLKP